MLYVITTFFNYLNISKKVELMNLLKEEAEQWKDAQLLVIELSYNGEFQVTEANNVNHFQVQTKTPFFHKENLINIVAKKVLENNDYFAWIDSDLKISVDFKKIMETLSSSEPIIIQPWDTVEDLGPNGEILSIQKSFLKEPSTGHLGYFWAMNKAAYEKIGGLFDMDIVGNGDLILAKSLVRKEFEKTHGKYLSQSYLKRVRKFEKSVSGIEHKCLPGKIVHRFHGPKHLRGYISRGELLRNFDPDVHLTRDSEGLLHLDPGFKEPFECYLISRKE